MIGSPTTPSLIAVMLYKWLLIRKSKYTGIVAQKYCGYGL